MNLNQRKYKLMTHRPHVVFFGIPKIIVFITGEMGQLVDETTAFCIFVDIRERYRFFELYAKKQFKSPYYLIISEHINRGSKV